MESAIIKAYKVKELEKCTDKQLESINRQLDKKLEAKGIN